MCMLSSHSSFVFYKVYRKFGRKPESNQNTSKKESKVTRRPSGLPQGVKKAEKGRV